MKDPKNKKHKLKAQETQVASSNNYSRSMEAFEKNCKEKKKKFLKEKQEKRKDLESILATGVNTTNSNQIEGYRRKDTCQVVYYICSNKDEFAWKCIKLRKDLKN